MSLRYINPSVQWTRYSKVLVEPVTFRGGDKTRISLADQQALCNFLYQALPTQLGKKFRLVEESGPRVMVLQVAISDAEAATPVVSSVTMVVPQARAFGTLKYLASGTYPLVGAAQMEGRLFDAGTGMTLGAWVDRRVGGGNVSTGAQRSRVMSRTS